MSSSLLSDCEKGGFRGPVKTIVDEYTRPCEVFPPHSTVFPFRSNTVVLERTYVYDTDGQLTRVRGSSGDDDDEFRYDGQGKIQIRHVPPRPDLQSRAFGVSVWFDAISEGEGLTDGGTVETTYNERDEPVEKRIFDEEGTLLFRIRYIHDENGRLSEEKLISENPAIPKAVREQIPVDERASVLAVMRKPQRSLKTGQWLSPENRPMK